MSNKFTVTIGADPEFFVQEKKGSVIPACGKFGGEKRAPMFLSPDGGYLEDGTAIEINVSPSKTLKECRGKIENLLLIFLAKHKDYVISRYSSAIFDGELLRSLPEAMHIGCSPDLFAYGLRTEPSIKKFGNRRFAGGHIHLGIDPWPEGLEKSTVIKMMDFLVLCPMLTMFCDPNRYPFYGHPGLYRETSYGVEHRSPDNSWCNPERFATSTDDARNHLRDVEKGFDKSVALFHSILERDTHGARLNDELNTYFKNNRLGSVLSTIEGIESPKDIMHYRRHNLEMNAQLMHLLECREEPQLQPKAKAGYVIHGG